MTHYLLSTQSCKELLRWANAQGHKVELGTDVGRFKPREPDGPFSLVRITDKTGKVLHIFTIAEWCRAVFGSRTT